MSIWEFSVDLDDKYSAILVAPEETKSDESLEISVDGMDADWKGMGSFSPDRIDDTGKTDRDLNIKDVYCYKDDSFIDLSYPNALHIKE